MSNEKRSLTVRTITVVIFLLIAILAVLILRFNTNNKDIGVLAVKTLYEFQNYGELDSKMEVLKGFVTEDVYNQLTIDTTERALRVYLKFKEKPTLVRIESSDDGVVIYRLLSESISKERVFMFKYEINKGKISKVYEAELLPFVGNE